MELITPGMSAPDQRSTVKGYACPWDEWHCIAGPSSLRLHRTVAPRRRVRPATRWAKGSAQSPG
jgi:hypothetical protein